MKVKSVIKCLKHEYGIGLEEINVIADERVLYSGPIDGWDHIKRAWICLPARFISYVLMRGLSSRGFVLDNSIKKF